MPVNKSMNKVPDEMLKKLFEENNEYLPTALSNSPARRSVRRSPAHALSLSPSGEDSKAIDL